MGILKEYTGKDKNKAEEAKTKSTSSKNQKTTSTAKKQSLSSSAASTKSDSERAQAALNRAMTTDETVRMAANIEALHAQTSAMEGKMSDDSIKRFREMDKRQDEWFKSTYGKTAEEVLFNAKADAYWQTLVENSRKQLAQELERMQKEQPTIVQKALDGGRSFGTNSTAAKSAKAAKTDKEKTLSENEKKLRASFNNIHLRDANNAIKSETRALTNNVQTAPDGERGKQTSAVSNTYTNYASESSKPNRVMPLSAEEIVSNAAKRKPYTGSESAAEVRPKNYYQWENYKAERDKHKKQTDKYDAAIQSQIDELRKKVDDEKSKLAEEALFKSGVVKEPLRRSSESVGTPSLFSTRSKIDEYNKKIRALEAQKYGNGRDLENWNFEQLDKHYAVMNNDDFEEYSKKGAVSDYSGAAKKYNKVERYNEGEKDRQVATAEQAANPSAVNAAKTLAHGNKYKDVNFVSFMTDAEKNIYNYYYGKFGADKADDFLDDISGVLNQRQAEFQNKNFEQFGNEHKVGTGIVRGVAGGTLAIPAGVDIAKQAFTNGDKPIDYNSPYTAGIRANEAVTEGITKNMNSAGKNAVELGISVLDNVSRIPLGPVVGAAVMGAQVFGQSAYDSARATDNKKKIVATAVLNGAAEFLGEKVGIKRLDEAMAALKGAKGFQPLVKYIVLSSAGEGIAEMATEAANIGTDIAIMGNESEL
ncbi:MAG: hypothetical protein ACI4SS_02330, partial [Clostridia bacterium]